LVCGTFCRSEAPALLADAVRGRDAKTHAWCAPGAA
jgi:hypothetical protein